ncbi:MAG: amidohydrolase family protein [candidate division WOR-3 bacterium]
MSIRIMVIPQKEGWSMIIDIDMHWLPENLFSDKKLLRQLLEIVPRAYGEYASVTTIPGTDKMQIIIEKPKGYVNLNYTELDVSPSKRLEDMKEAGVDKAILRITCWQEWLTLDLCKKFNDLLAAYINEHADKFLGLAVVPPWGNEESLEEMDRCIKDLGFSGIQCVARYGTLYLDEEEFRPFFKKVNQLGVPLVVHHTPLPVEYNSIYKYTNLRRQYGRCMVQMISLSRILFSGLLDDFPNLVLIFTMLGGGFFAYTKMLAGERSKTWEEIERFDPAAEKVRKYLDKNIYFELTAPTIWSKHQLECAVKELGADHILFGSGYPVRREWLLKGVEYIRSLDVSEKEKEQILGENAISLFKIKV